MAAWQACTRFASGSGLMAWERGCAGAAGVGPEHPLDATPRAGVPRWGRPPLEKACHGAPISTRESAENVPRIRARIPRLARNGENRAPDWTAGRRPEWGSQPLPARSRASTADQRRGIDDVDRGADRARAAAGVAIAVPAGNARGGSDLLGHDGAMATDGVEALEADLAGAPRRG